MKKLIIFTALFLVSLSSCHKDKDKKFFGIVPIGAEPKIEFVKGNIFSFTDPYYDADISIEVLRGEEKLMARFDPGRGVIHREYIEYRNIHPLSQGRLIYVSGIIDEKGMALIRSVSLRPIY